jgi:hypothetical protein
MKEFLGLLIMTLFASHDLAAAEAQGFVLYSEPPSTYMEACEFASLETGKPLYSIITRPDGKRIQIDNGGKWIRVDYPPKSSKNNLKDLTLSTVNKIQALIQQYPQFKQQLDIAQTKWKNAVTLLPQLADGTNKKTPQVQKSPPHEPAEVHHTDVITTLKGKKYEVITIDRVEPDGLIVVTETGVVKIQFSEISPELRSKYGYDPKKEADYNAELRRQSGAGQQQVSVNDLRGGRQPEQVKKNVRWIVGKVLMVQYNEFLVCPPSDQVARKNGISEKEELGVTDFAYERLRHEQSSLPGDLQAHLLKAGTFFTSVRGMQYVADNWIKSPKDYQMYFVLERLFQAKNFLKSLAVVPLIDTDQPVFVKIPKSFRVVEGDYVSLWVVSDNSSHTENGNTYMEYRLFGTE